ncbi:hypothetical protein B4144_1803 [Bacillus atrophaeus]|nr:hypothetical protein B4144_1803 [Bacillus atrophaeus]
MFYILFDCELRNIKDIAETFVKKTIGLTTGLRLLLFSAK